MKKITGMILAFLIFFNIPNMAYATSTDDSNTRASNYLTSYGILLSQSTNHRLAITVDVEAKRQMSIVGVFEIYIEEYSDTLGAWTEYDVWYGSSNPSLYYAYNSWDYSETFYFTGTPGNKYRVTFTCFAADSSGSDTGSIVSVTRTCP